jgi:hypothetical protein
MSRKSRISTIVLQLYSRPILLIVFPTRLIIILLITLLTLLMLPQLNMHASNPIITPLIVATNIQPATRMPILLTTLTIRHTLIWLSTKILILLIIFLMPPTLIQLNTRISILLITLYKIHTPIQLGTQAPILHTTIRTPRTLTQLDSHTPIILPTQLMARTLHILLMLSAALTLIHVLPIQVHTPTTLILLHLLSKSTSGSLCHSMFQVTQVFRISN